MQLDYVPGHYVAEGESQELGHGLENPGVINAPASCDELPVVNTLNEAHLLRNGEVITTVPDRTLTVVLVGETGTGKTTFISLLHNVLAGTSPMSYTDIRDPINEAGGGQKQSQTQHPFIYELLSRNGVTFRIIDTPGLSDTRGMDHDELHKREFVAMMRDHVTNVHAVFLFANGTVPRLGPATEYVFNVLATMFPRSIADNIGIVFTNVASMMNVNFDFDSLPAHIPPDHVFCINNPFALQNRLKTIESSGQKPKVLNSLRHEVTESETKALKALVDMLDWLDSVAPQPTKVIVELFEKTQAIEAELSRVHASMLASASMQQELKRVQGAITWSIRTANLYKGYQTVVTKARMQLMPTEFQNTICMESGCQTNCWHAPGRFPFKLIMPPGNTSYEVVVNTLKGRFIGCGLCKHPYGDHQTSTQRWEEVYGTETRTDEEMKQKFDSATSGAERKRIVRQTIEHRLAQIQEEIANATATVSKLVDSYAKLSLSGSFTSHIYTAIKLLNLNLEALRHDIAPLATIEQIEQSIAALEEKLDVLEAARESGVRRGSPLTSTRGFRDHDGVVGSSYGIADLKSKVSEISETANHWLSSL